MICLVGGSPSSGSTLLSDLLDSSPFSASGPELEFFCNEHIYNFHSFKTNRRKTSKLFAPRSTDIFFRSDFLPEYGITEKEWNSQLDKSSSLKEFTSWFVAKFLHHRGKSKDGIVFEKTPQNANAIDLFLNQFQDSYYIHIVRNPLNVYASLLKRGWGAFTSAATWHLYAAKASAFMNHPRVIVVKYEDLISNPFHIIAEILHKIQPNSKLEPTEIKEHFESNLYRQNIQGIATWDTKNRSQISPTQKEIDPDTKMELASFLEYRIHSKYRKKFNLPDFTFKQAIALNGYNTELNELSALANQSDIQIKPSSKELVKLCSKWTRGVVNGNYSLGELSMFLNVIQPN